MQRFFFLTLLILPVFLQAQRPGGNGGQNQIKGTVSGILIDSLTRDPLEFASVGLLDAKGTAVNGALTDDKGLFRIPEVSLGRYTLQVSYVGYATKVIQDVQLTPRKPDSDLGTLVIAPEARLLEEIQVVGEAALIEARPDKIVYNAENDVTTRGGDASDVLRKVPLLAVDIEGNVSLRGSENVRILINGRPSGIFNGNVADALKMFPADQIKSVEVITTPSARFDGEGTAGIINIITRKKSVEGVAGSAEVTAGIRSNRANFNTSYGKGRLALNVSGGGHYGWPQVGASRFTREEFGTATPSLIAQDGTNKTARLGFRTFAGLEYAINAYSTINAEVSFRGFDSRRENEMHSVYTESSSLVDEYTRITDAVSARGGWDWELDYRRTFPQKEREWTVAVQLDRDDDRSEADYLVDYTFPLEFSDVLERNLNDGQGLEWIMQTDYVHPISPAVKIETGVKATLRNIVSDFKFLNYEENLNYWNLDPSRTDIFDYTQNVYAGYLSSSVKMGEKVTLIAGGRLEGTYLKGSFEQFDAPFENDYLHFLPTLIVSQKVGKMNQLKVGYTQRIQRPGQRNVNPFIEYNDNRDISFGNPQLFPERMHQIELGSNWFLNGSMLNISLFGRRTEDLIENLLRINEEGVSETTYSNFGRRDGIGLNVFGSLTFGENLTVRGGFDVNAWRAEGTFEGRQLDNTGYDYSGRPNMTWNITKTLRVEGFTYFRSPTFTVQGKTPNWSMMSFGLRKEWPERRFSLGINLTEPFRENLRFIRELSGDNFYQYSSSARPVRSIGLTIGYRFGKLDFKDRQNRGRANSNDQKEADTGESGF